MLEKARSELQGETSVWKLWQSNADFHCALIAMSRNPYLQKHLTQCLEVERRYFAQNQWNDTRAFEMAFHPEAHEAIYRAIREGRKEDALSLLRKDIIGQLEN